MNDKIGITGATGVLGKILCSRLESLGYAYDKFVGNICQQSDVDKWMEKNHFSAIIHLAAIVPTKEVEEDPFKAYSVNVGGTINLLGSALKKDQKPWIFYAGSSHVYQSKNAALKEDDEVDPVSQYGVTKYMGEKICQDVLENGNYDISICCGRIFSFYHESQNPPFLFPNIKRRLAEEDLTRPFFLYGAECERDFLNAEVVVDIIIELMKNKATGIVNIASGRATKIREFVQSLTEVELEIVTDESAPNSLVADIEKLKSIIGTG